MLTSVAALNPAQRFKSSILSLKRNAAATVAIRHALQFRASNNLKDDNNCNKSNFLRFDFRSHSTRSSSQLEYDRRKGSAIKDYQEYEAKSLRLQEPLPLSIDQRIEAEPEYTEEKAKLNIKIVDTVEKAREVLAIMYAQHARNPRTVWACDTEVADIDLSLVGNHNFKRGMLLHYNTLFHLLCCDTAHGNFDIQKNILN